MMKSMSGRGGSDSMQATNKAGHVLAIFKKSMRCKTMASKHSKKTLALLAQFPNFDSWIINNLSAEQLYAVMQTQMGAVNFGGNHPLNSQLLGVALWRAYRDQIIFELECIWGEDNDYTQPAPTCDRNEYFHASVCIAIGNYAREQDELMEAVIERQKGEIAQAMAAAPIGQPERRPRL